MSTKYKYGVPLVLENVIQGVGSNLCITTDHVIAEVIIQCKQSVATSINFSKRIQISNSNKFKQALIGFCEDIGILNLSLALDIKILDDEQEFHELDLFSTSCMALSEVMRRRQEPQNLSQLIHQYSSNFIKWPSACRIDSLLYGGVRVASSSKEQLSSRIYHPRGLQLLVGRKFMEYPKDLHFGDLTSALADFIIGFERNQMGRIKASLQSNFNGEAFEIKDILGICRSRNDLDYAVCMNTSSAEKFRSVVKRKGSGSFLMCKLSEEGIMRY